MREVAHGRSDGVNDDAEVRNESGRDSCRCSLSRRPGGSSRNKDLEFADAGIELVLFGVGGFIETWKIGR